MLTEILSSFLMFLAIKWLLKIFASRSPLSDLPGPAPHSWLSGNLGQLFNSKGMPFHLSLADTYGGVVKVYGFFGDEQLYVSDPRALQSIISKDQDCFEETSVFTETNKVIFGPGLVATTGEQHKRQRRAVIPIFGVPQLRRIMPVFYEIAEKFSVVLEAEVRDRKSKNDSIHPEAPVLDMSDWMSRVALESVGRTVLGYSFDPLDSPHNNPYTSAVKELIPTLFRLALVRQFAPFLAKLGPTWFRRKLVEWTPNSAVQKIKDMSDVMHDTAVKILQGKREAMNVGLGDGETENLAGGRDIITALLKANEDSKQTGGEQLTDSELTGQMTVLIFGAQDTTSSCLSRLLHLLAQHPDVQDKIRAEIRSAQQDKENYSKDDRLSYDAISKLPWLEAVIKETLRLYPPVPFVRRSCIKETVLSFTKPTGELSSVTVPKGTILFVGIATANRLETIWGSDAKEWKPERWLSDTSPMAQDPSLKLPGIYHGMLSFFGGGRACVGYKFAQLEISAYSRHPLFPILTCLQPSGEANCMEPLSNSLTLSAKLEYQRRG
ncbi:cytochrome P450 [Crepidotus variabilis]|uniref:Cytochrome P450 n=1 Tax=Crepidotus variabilis TaxID=179855 RepID=A0A9P6EEZ1_9AGAR|nr:cytochrome P450 [Crepidotus variabilis]